MSERFAMAAYAKARKAEGFLLVAIVCAAVLTFLIPIGVKFCTILEPLRVALGK